MKRVEDADATAAPGGPASAGMRPGLANLRRRGRLLAVADHAENQVAKLPTARPTRRSRLGRILSAGVLAVVAHVGVGIFLSVSGALASLSPSALPPLVEGLDAREAANEEPLSVESLVDELEHPPAPTAQERKVEKEINEKDARGQVVDIARPSIEQRPDEARFAAEYDSSVSHETKGPAGLSKAGAVVPGAVAPPPSEAQARSTPLPAAASPAKTPPTALAMHGPIGTRVPGPAGPQSAVREFGPDGDQPHQGGQGEVRPPEVAGGGALPGGGPRPNLAPSTAILQQALGEGAGSPDYLHDLDDGDATGLNAKKWKFAAFFNRMKTLVRGEWHPDQLLSRHDPSGNIYGVKDRVSVLRVELQLDGRVKDVSIKQSSGVEFLDEEAMSAFRRAQPFENAPQPLADPDGVIRFNFAFIVQLSGRTSFKVYRE